MTTIDTHKVSAADQYSASGSGQTQSDQATSPIYKAMNGSLNDIPGDYDNPRFFDPASTASPFAMKVIPNGYANLEQLMQGFERVYRHLPDDSAQKMERVITQFSDGYNVLNPNELDQAFASGVLVRERDGNISINLEALQKEFDRDNSSFMNLGGWPTSSSLASEFEQSGCVLKAQEPEINWLIATYGHPVYGNIQSHQLAAAEQSGALNVDLVTGTVTIDTTRPPPADYKSGGAAMYDTGTSYSFGDMAQYDKDVNNNTPYPTHNEVTLPESFSPVTPEQLRELKPAEVDEGVWSGGTQRVPDFPEPLIG